MFLDKLDNIEKRYYELESLLSQPQIISDQDKFHAFSKEFSILKEIVEEYKTFKTIQQQIKDAKIMLNDKDLRDLAQNELDALIPQADKIQKSLELMLLPKDPLDDKNIIMEIRAGTGGEEAALFAGDLFRMYLRYAERHGYKTEILSSSSTGLGGYKEVIFSILGKGAYSHLKYEGGAHRVQRVPKTETSGRIHTSAATVAVLPEAEDVDLKIEEKDLRIDTFRASGAGGQNVNKTDSAVRITHIPTGTVVACQEERSQLQNRVKAMKLLKSRILQEQEEREHKRRAETRKIMVGSGDRSEKIRTYNFPQGRITDHRIGFTLYQMNDFLDGALDEMIEALTYADNTAKLSKMT